MLERTGALILMLVFSWGPLVAQCLALEQTGDTAASLSRGQQISHAVATVTGVSVSPLG
jgi:hypothetical protein